MDHRAGEIGSVPYTGPRARCFDGKTATRQAGVNDPFSRRRGQVCGARGGSFTPHLLSCTTASDARASTRAAQNAARTVRAKPLKINDIDDQRLPDLATFDGLFETKRP